MDSWDVLSVPAGEGSLESVGVGRWNGDPVYSKKYQLFQSCRPGFTSCHQAQCLLVKIGIILPIVHEQWGTLEQRREFPSPLLSPPPIPQTLHRLFWSGPSCSVSESGPPWNNFIWRSFFLLFFLWPSQFLVSPHHIPSLSFSFPGPLVKSHLNVYVIMRIITLH